MPEVDLSVIGKKRGPVVWEYSWKDVILYALGVGAGTDELEFIYEGAPGGLKVLPSFCVASAACAYPNVGDVNWSLFLHGEHRIRLSKPLSSKGKLSLTGEVLNIYDKGKGALYEVMITGTGENGEHVFDSQWSNYYVGAGGFGGDPGPKARPIVPPKGVEPDFSISYPAAPNQAAIYRFSGDLNPLHLDPRAAKAGGFDRPILHGLCTYGFAVRAIVNGPLEGNVSRLKEFRARFSSVVFPGDTLTTMGWKDGDNYIIQAETQNGPVLTNALAVCR